MKDPFVLKYNPSELKIAAEFLTTWLPFLTRDLCRDCTQSISNRILSLDPASSTHPDQLDLKEIHCDSCDSDTNSLGSWKENPAHLHLNAPAARVSWADMAAQEEESQVTPVKLELTRQQRERIRFNQVGRKKDFACFETIRGETVNILHGLELHTAVFSSVEQKRIVDYIYTLEQMGRRQEFRERTFSAPHKWMRGKGRVTIQFGCCYNYALLKDGKPPGILRDQYVDPIPHLFKVMIRRLIGWHVLPPSCVPDSCIVNIYDEGDCIPPHIDHHDFLRPFCTVSFLSECNIVFGSTLKALGPGEFSGAVAIPLPVGSVLVLNGNGADVAKHCVPAVPTKRISITFRKMDQSKHPFQFVPEPDLQGLEPLPYDVDEANSTNPLNSPPKISMQPVVREADSEKGRGILGRGGSQTESTKMNGQPVMGQTDSEKGRGFLGRGSQSEPRFTGQARSQSSGSRRRVRVSLGT